MPFEQTLAQHRKEKNYDYETDGFTVEILASNRPESPKLGADAPHFSLPNENGVQFDMNELLNRGPIILSFFKGEWCSYCDLELKNLQRSIVDFDKYGATVLGISPHTISISYKLKEQKELSYNILSDSGNKIAEQYGLKFPLSTAFSDAMAGFGLDFPTLNEGQSKGEESLPIPGTFVIDRGGKIIYSFVDTDHTKRAEPADIIASLMSVS